MAKKLNLIGRKFGRLLVIEPISQRTKCDKTLWLCKCDCGNDSIVMTGNLMGGNTKSCGCLQKERTSKCSKLDVTGRKFGRLLAIKNVGSDKWGMFLWKCRCECGNETIVAVNNLVRGNTCSCGCLRKEMTSGENSCWWVKDRSKLLDLSLRAQITCLFEYRDWRKQIYERDNYVCQKCGKRGYELHAHHLILLSEILSYYNITTIKEVKKCLLLFDINNGITLCENCHRWVHSNENTNKEFLKNTEGVIQCQEN